jgi:hypothetical protein
MATETRRQCAREVKVHQNAMPKPTVSTTKRIAVTRSSPQ